MFVTTKRSAPYQRIILNLESIFSIVMFTKRNAYFYHVFGNYRANVPEFRNLKSEILN